MSGTRKCHFVPQCYLKQFEINNKHQIATYDLKTQKIYTQNINTAAQKRDFYKIKSSRVKDEDLWEKIYAQFYEPLLKQQIDKLKKYSLPVHNCEVPVLNEVEQLLWKILMIHQMLRDPKRQQIGKNIYSNTYNIIRNSFAPYKKQMSELCWNVIERFGDFESNNDILMHASFPENHMNLLIYLDHIKLVVVRFDSDCLITSDCPAFIDNHITTLSIKENERLTIKMIYPVAPNLLICGLEIGPVFNIGVLNAHYRITGGYIFYVSVQENIELIKQINQCIMENCDRFLFASDENVLYKLKDTILSDH